MKIGVDLDDVVVDFVNPLLKFYQEYTGRKVLFEDFFSYNFNEVWGITREEAINLVGAFYRSEEFTRLNPIDGALESLQQLSEKNDITFITSRHNDAKQPTLLWTSRNCPFITNPVIFAGEYQCEENKRFTKADICLREGIGCMVEDNGPYSLECAQKGITTYLLNRPWNKGVAHQNIIRTNDWNKIVNDILHHRH